MKTIRQLEEEAILRLSLEYEPAEAREIARRLIEDLRGLRRTDLLLLTGKDTLLSPEEITLLERALHRLEAAEPLQYVLGKASFLGGELQVAPGVLIPRPETEELAQLILQHPEASSWRRLLDVGTGSGCLAWALAKYLPQLDQAIALEVSSQAIPIAQENFRRLYEQSGREVNLWHKDLFALVESHTPPPTPLDLIVSNPPYIHPSEAEDMTAHVLLYEPHLALFAPEESPLAYYTAIGQLVRQGYLRSGGSLWLELNPLYAEQTRTALLHTIGSEQAEAELIKDMSGKNRFLHLTYHSA